MHSKTSGFGAARPAHLGRHLAIEALGHIQHIDDPNINLELVTESIAKATGSLYASRRLEIRNPSHVALIMNAMDELRLTQRLLRKGDSEADHTNDALAAVAKTLAVLYPVSQVKVFRQHHSGIVNASLQSEAPDPPLRISDRTDVTTHVGFQSGTEFCVGMSTNLSVGGIQVSTHNTLPPGTPVNIYFHLPNGYFVAAEATAQWSCSVDSNLVEETSGMGVYFDRLDDDDRDEITNCVVQTLSIPPKSDIP